MKRIFIIAYTSKSGLANSVHKISKIQSRLAKKSFEVNHALYTSGLEQDTPGVVNLKHNSQSLSRALTHAFHNPWPADYYIYLNFDLKPQENEVLRVLEAVTSKYCHCAFGSALIGKTDSRSHVFDYVFSRLVQAIHPNLKFVDTQTAIITLDQSSVLAIRSQISRVPAHSIITEILTKLNRFGLSSSAIPVTVNIPSPSIKDYISNVYHAFKNRNWKPTKQIHTKLSRTHLNHLLTD